MAIALAVFVYLVVRISWWLTGFVFRGAQPRSARWSLQRPLLGRWSPSSVRRLRGLANHGPDAVLPRTATTSTRPTRSMLVGSGAISPAPDLGAFTAGLEVMVFTALFTVSALLVLMWIIKMMRGSE